MYKKTVDYEDNQGAIALVRNPACRQNVSLWTLNITSLGISYGKIRCHLFTDPQTT